MDFWQRIDHTGERYADRDIDVYGKLRGSSLPLYLYGAGNLAENILKRLKENGIPLAGILVDFGETAFAVPEGLRVYRYQEFVQSREENSCDLLLGFSAAYERKPLLEQEPVFHEVFEIANPYDHHNPFDYAFVKEHRSELEEVYDWLADEYSRECFCAFINARIWENSDYVREIFRGEMLPINNELLRLGANETFVDVGAYQGRSIGHFLQCTHGRYAKIIGIEPESRNFAALKRFCEANHIDAELHQIGCWSKKDRLAFNADAGSSCRLEAGASDFIEVDALDHIISSQTQVSLINIGTSIAVREILEGGKRIIEQNAPQILLGMMAAKEGLYAIPQHLKKANTPSPYKFYFRFVNAMPTRSYLYAIPEIRER